MTTVYVLELVGYDENGGHARVFSTPEKAMADAPEVAEWVPDGEGWYEKRDADDAYGTRSIHIIRSVQVDPKEVAG